jgi:hypothetical protein
VACCCLNSFAMHFVLLVICKPRIRFQWCLYNFQLESSNLSSGILGLPRVWPYPSCHHLRPSRHPIPRNGSPLAPCVAFFICIHVHRACSMCSFPCHVYMLCIYHVVCFFPVVLLLDSPGFVAIVRTRSTTLGSSMPVRLLHGLGLLPSGISGKMTDTLDLTTIFAMLVVSMRSLCCATYHLFIKPPKLPWNSL